MIKDAVEQLHAIKSDVMVIGNGLSGYVSDHAVSIIDYLDGVVIEHFGSFEGVDGNGKIKPDLMRVWVELIK